MSKNRKRECELCGSPDERFFMSAKGVDLFCDRSFRLFKCHSCALIHLDDEIRPEEMEALGFKERHDNPYSFRSCIYNFGMNIFISMRIKKVENLKANGAVLDIGCGDGRFLKKMHSTGWDCYGADISQHAGRINMGEERIKIFRSDIIDIKLPGKFFDLVTFWQSFEHMRYPSLVLKRAHELLKDDGVLFISVPNIESFEARLNLKKWFGLELPRHVYQYSPGTLTGLLEKNGFDVIALSKNSAEYNPPFFVQTFLNAMGGEVNLFYNFFKKGKSAGKVNIFRRIYTIFLTIILLPFTLAGTVAAYFVNIVCGKGPIIEISAVKRRG